MKINSNIKSFLNVLSSNMYNLVLGIVLSFILPNVLGPTNYGFWSLFTLYVSYAGVLIFGFADGIYLTYGGYLYKDLDKRKISSYYFVMVVYLSILLLLSNILLNIYDFEKDYLIVYRFISIASMITCLNSFLSYINQATARFKIYSISNIISKTIISLTAVGIFLFKNNSFKIAILGNIIGLIVTNLYLTFKSKEVILHKPIINKEIFKEIFSNIKCGIILTISGVSAMLMMSFGKFLIEKKLGIEELGYYSFAFSITALFTQVIYAISTVIYPLVKRLDNKIDYIFENIDNVIIILSGIILLLYFPCRYLLNILFSDYVNSFGCLMYLFPIIICDARVILTYSSKYKVKRNENKILYVILVSIVFCVLITLLLFYIFKSMEIVALATYIGFLFWICIWAIVDRKKIVRMDLILELLYIIINLLIGWNVYALIINIIVIMVAYTIKYKFIKLCLKNILEMVKE